MSARICGSSSDSFEANGQHCHSSASGTQRQGGQFCSKDDFSEIPPRCLRPPPLLEKEIRQTEQQTDKSRSTYTSYLIRNLDLSNVPKNEFILATPREVKLMPDLTYVTPSTMDSTNESSKEDEALFSNPNTYSFHAIQAQQSLDSDEMDALETGRILFPVQEMDSDEEGDIEEPPEMMRPLPIGLGYRLRPRKALRLPVAFDLANDMFAC